MIAYGPGDKKITEVMRYLPAGTYSLRMSLREVELNRLSVRTIPVLIYATVGYNPYLLEFGRYDWGWLDRIGMLDNCNTIVNRKKKPTLSTNIWLGQGKQVFVHAGVPSLRSAVSEVESPVTEESSYKYWIEDPGLNDPAFSGVLADEFGAWPPVKEYLPVFIPAIQRVLKARPDRKFYAYLGDSTGKDRFGDAVKLKSFVKPLFESGCYFAYERYLQEKDTRDEAKDFIEKALKGEMLEFKKYAPGFATRCIYVIGFQSAPRMSLNKNPAVDYKVHLDMQFQLMATDPAFEGIHGIEEYISPYCDEEYLRWCAKLFRHYCIEGRTERLSNDPYELRHIQNPDFEQGLEHWTVEAASPGSVQAKRMEGYGKLQGRYPQDRPEGSRQGDTFLWTKRDAEKPNIVSQEIRNLEPGRFYSVKAYVGDYADPTRGGQHMVWLQVTGAEAVPEEDIHGTYYTSHNSSVERFEQKKTYFSYIRTVFRATSDTARLSIHDKMVWSRWYKPVYRKADVGQELAINFIEVEPYLMPDSLRDPAAEKVDENQ